MRALIAAGGTAGHINPALAIAREILAREPLSEILFVGTQRGMEKELIPREGFKIEFIEAKGFIRKPTPQNIQVAYLAVKAYFTAAGIISKFRPDVVIGCGGYVSGPVLLCAALMGKPTLIHEQNVFPGLTTKMLSKCVRKVAVSFVDTKKIIKQKNVYITGNPVRKGLLAKSRREAKRALGIEETKRLLVIAGGSLGSDVINRATLQMLTDWQEDIHVLWSCGKGRYENVKKEAERLGVTNHKNITITDYIYQMEEAMAGADLMISRAGAITLSELCAIGRASVLIPSPNVTDNHQEYNARALEEQGAAMMLTEKKLLALGLGKTVKTLMSDTKKLSNMEKCAKSMGIGDAAEKIYDLLCELLEKCPKDKDII